MRAGNGVAKDRGHGGSVSISAGTAHGDPLHGGAGVGGAVAISGGVSDHGVGGAVAISGGDGARGVGGTYYYFLKSFITEFFINLIINIYF